MQDGSPDPVAPKRCPFKLGVAICIAMGAAGIAATGYAVAIAILDSRYKSDRHLLPQARIAHRVHVCPDRVLLIAVRRRRWPRLNR